MPLMEKPGFQIKSYLLSRDRIGSRVLQSNEYVLCSVDNVHGIWHSETVQNVEHALSPLFLFRED